MGLSRAQQPHSGARGPGRDANVQSRNPQNERPKFLLFSLFLTLFSDCCVPTAGTWLCPNRMVPQGGWWAMLLHRDAPHSDTALGDPSC